MTDPEKKISFGFNKFVRKPNSFIKPKGIEEKKVELIDCLEGQSIKIKFKTEEVKGPLVIPIPENSRSIVDRIKNECLKNVSLKKEQMEVPEFEKPESELTLDELAVRELLKDARNRQNQTHKPKIETLPLVEDKLIIEGKEESTLEDYESVPIGDYGMAMLRGMGWKEDIGIGKNPKNTAKVDIPELRPRGMGLGADRMAKNTKKSEKIIDKDGKELKLIKGAFAKINDGRYDGYYCEIQGLDDEAGRIIVKTAIGGTVLTLNEFRVTLVTKGDYEKNAKILNNAKYTEYKEKESTDTKNASGSAPSEKIKIKEEPKPNISSCRNKSDIKTKDNSYGNAESQPISSDSDHQSRKKHSRKSQKSSKSQRYEDKHGSTEDENVRERRGHSDKKSSREVRKYEQSSESSSEDTGRHRRKRKSSSSDSRDSSEDGRRKDRSRQKHEKYKYTDSSSDDSDADNRSRSKTVKSSKHRNKDKKHKKHSKDKKREKKGKDYDDRYSRERKGKH